MCLLTGRTDPEYANPKYPACLFQVVQEILDHGELTTEKQRKKLAEYMNKIGLHDIANLLHPSVQDTSRQVSPYVSHGLEDSCDTLVPEIFHEAAKKSSGNSSTESHFHAVDSCQICHLSNYTINQSPGCYHDSSNQERGSDSGAT